ncbi:hypothetical protein Acy02nite_89770 [Actinoplanes cyaneus]|uniref:Uncharacterized protein n=1 Tax=Actinoplanes cyaneus TaxID=52696 RepID=A0A919IU63_9ACTN|nr:hypothetical protein [Actinoplanes cyaneus]MCW2144360.1 hypothetical protein [Actinoplanes cyaneus]GID71096.1 hypothetical protein Acy02nite_89770 [Actinoplanes cyaneus]
MTNVRDEYGEQAWRFFSGLHRVLLRLAGQIPDELLTGLRSELGEGNIAEVPHMVSATALELGVSLTTEDFSLLREVTLAVQGTDPWGAELVTVTEQLPAPDFRFFPVTADVLATDATRIPRTLDLTDRPGNTLLDLPAHLGHLDDLVLRLTDSCDSTQHNAARLEEDVVSTARAWRFPAAGPIVGGTRVVLVEVSEYAPAWAIAETIRRDLSRTECQVEVYWTDEVLPPYHQAALAGAALFWCARSPAARE